MKFIRFHGVIIPLDKFEYVSVFRNKDGKPDGDKTEDTHRLVLQFASQRIWWDGTEKKLDEDLDRLEQLLRDVGVFLDPVEEKEKRATKITMEDSKDCEVEDLDPPQLIIKTGDGTSYQQIKQGDNIVIETDGDITLTCGSVEIPV